MQGNVGRVAARYLPHSECEAYVAGPAVMVRETIGVLARSGIPQERIHYDDALLAADKRMSPSPARAETEQTGDARDAGVAEAAAEDAPPDEDARSSETTGETSRETSRDASGEQPEREQVSAGHLRAPT
jgi:ferredoxin-NADP reductase